jgi:KipI family sensor histidine kinase inhibitor
MSVRVLPSGEAALLVECDELGEVLAVHDALAEAAIPGVVELVPAARTLLVAIDPATLPLESAAALVRRAGAPRGGSVPRAGHRAPGDRPPAPRAASGAAPAAAAAVVVPVTYDGADLVEAAALLNCSPEALIARHTTALWRVAFVGFAPGFAYLVSADWPVDVPRLASPRTRVPAGAVGLAGGFSGVYPRESPGGWQLIGRTALPLWDVDADPPARLTPGTTVRFERIAP